MSDEYILPGEFLALVSLAWLPVFFPSSIFQWRKARHANASWLVALTIVTALFMLQAAIALALWLSPAAKPFAVLTRLPGIFGLISLPMLCAVIAAAIGTYIEILVLRVFIKRAKHAAT